MEENYRHEAIGRMNFDVFIPKLNTAIEYDGQHWHRQERDARKNRLCRDAGITIIRVRESGCLPVEDCITIPVVYRDHESMDNAIIQVLDTLAMMAGVCNDVDVDYERDLRLFLSMKALRSKKNSIAEKFPELVPEFDVIENHGVTPDCVSAYCNDEYIWRCLKCGQTWPATPASRAMGNGCSICDRKTIVQGLNDLATTNQKMAEHFDWEAAGKKNPTNVSAGTNEILPWKCPECGASFNRKGYSMNRKGGTGLCESCAHKAAGRNRTNRYLESGHRLCETDEWIANIWHPFLNDGLTP